MLVGKRKTRLSRMPEMETLSRPQTAEDRRIEEAGLSVIIPAYNECLVVGPVIEALSDDLKPLKDWPFEIIVVDDGSSDGTGDIAEETGARVIRHKSNRRYGAALKTGIRAARYGVICITDADGTYPNGRIPDLLERLNESDSSMVVGARTGADVAIPFLRRAVKRVIVNMAGLVVNQRIPDLNSGLRVFRRKIAMRFLSLLPNGFSFTTTITMAMLSNGYIVEFIPIDYYERVGRSKFRPIGDTFNFVSLVMRIALYFTPLKVFLPLSGLMLVLAIMWALITKLVFGLLADVSTMVIVMASVQVAVVGLLAELISKRLPNYYRDEE